MEFCVPVAKNGNWIKVGAISAAGGLIVIIITILGFTKGVIDERIDARILARETATEKVHAEDLAEIKKDIAVMKEQYRNTSEDIKEIKALLKEKQ
jgi:hypothetical protein